MSVFRIAARALRTFGLRLLPLFWIAVPPALAAATPQQVSPERHRFDLSSLFADDAAWERERSAVTERLDSIGRLSGTFGKSAETLADGLDAIADLRRRAGKLALYATLRSDADIRSEKARAMASAGTALADRVDAGVAFADREVRAIGSVRLEEWLHAEPRLEVHRRRVRRIQREASHAGDADSQALLREAANWPAGCAAAYWALLESDLPWPKMRPRDGAEVPANYSTFVRLRNSSDRAERRAATELFLNRLEGLQDAFGVLLTRRIEADATIARHRGFRDGIAAHLFREGLPDEAFRALLRAMHDNTPLLGRYLALRAQATGVPRTTFDSIRVPLPSSGGDRHVPIDESLRTIVAASAPLGAEFQSRLRRRLAMPWADLDPSPSKRETYEIFPRVGGAEPIGLMSYRDDLASSRALAGLATLLVTFASVPPERSFDRWEDDTGIYSNGVLEAGRLLHDDWVVAHAPGDRERIAATVAALDALTNAFFRYGAVAEFESLVQERVLAGDPPSGRRLSEMYLKLLRRLYEPGKAVEVEEMFGREWIAQRISFGSFEMVNFPLAAAAAASLVEKASRGDQNARRGFTDLLGRGEIDLSYPLLQSAGVDLAASDPYDALLRRMQRLVEELHRVIGGKAGP